jgi:4-amino-4-deoxy-L-arabinose transferase-like glycosyltransferase
MRLVPALLGLATVSLPWLLRGRLGNLGALATVLVLAFSPLLINISRTAGGDAIAVFAVALTFTAALRFRQTGEQRWAVTLGCALGLGLASVPLFFSGLTTLGIAWYLALNGRPDVKRIAIGQTALQIAPQVAWRTVGLAAAVVFVLLSTLFLLHPQGLGAAARLPAVWLGQFALPFGMQEGDLAVSSPFLTLARYEPLLLLALPGVIAAFWSLGEKQQPGLFFVVWVASLGVLWLVQPGVLNNVVLLILPAALLIGLASEALFRESRNATLWVVWGVAVGLLFLGLLILVALARFSRLAAFNPLQGGQLWLAMLAVIVAATLVFAAASWDSTAALQGAWLGAAMLLLYFQWGTGWHLNQRAANDPRERWVMVGTHNEVRLIVETMKEISRQAVGSDHDLAIFSVVDSPVLRWHLRDFPRFQSGAAVPLQSESDVVISPADSELALGSDYVGTDFRLTRQKAAGTIQEGQSSLLNTLNWWLFHESGAPVDDMTAVIWVRSDLVNP